MLWLSSHVRSCVLSHAEYSSARAQSAYTRRKKDACYELVEENQDAEADEERRMETKMKDALILIFLVVVEEGNVIPQCKRSEAFIGGRVTSL